MDSKIRNKNFEGPVQVLLCDYALSWMKNTFLIFAIELQKIF